MVVLCWRFGPCFANRRASFGAPFFVVQFARARCLIIQSTRPIRPFSVLYAAHYASSVPVLFIQSTTFEFH